jgi:hypothetical protein
MPRLYSLPGFKRLYELSVPFVSRLPRSRRAGLPGVRAQPFDPAPASPEF